VPAFFADGLQFDNAKAAYRRVLDRDPKHAKVLQQLGWLHHQQSSSYPSQEQAIDYLEKSVNSGVSPANYLMVAQASL
jgi:general transcriptional corepressor CYC8